MPPDEAAFFRELRALFEVESKEHLSKITENLLALEEGVPEEAKEEKIQEIFRLAHSLKGGARAVNQTDIQDVCQEFETVLASLRDHKLELTDELFSILHHTVKEISHAIVSEANQEHLKLLKKNLTAFNLGEKVEIIEEVPAEVSVKIGESKTIRVSTEKLDKLFQEVEELLILKLISEKRIQSLLSIQSDLSDWQKRWSKMERELREVVEAIPNVEGGAFLKKRMAELLLLEENCLKNFNERLSEVVKSRYLDFHLTNTMIDTLLEDTKKLLMQPFNSIFEIFPSMVRDLAKSEQKAVALKLEGGSIEVDRRILEEMKDPLIHLLRNSIDHGIETEKERAVLGKPAKAELLLSVSQQSGSTVQILLKDDGRGVSTEEVKKCAIEKGILSSDTLLKDEDALMLIFRPGFSTSKIISDLSGRGVGLAVVMEKVEKLGGSIKVETSLNKGTQFKITLPLTLATFRGVEVICNGHSLIVPTQHINRIIRASEKNIETIEGKPSIILEGHVLQYVPLADLLGLEGVEGQTQSEGYIIIFKVLEVFFAVGVDQILNEQEVYVKALKKPLIRLKNISSATILEGGKVAPILDPFDLVKQLKVAPQKQNKRGSVSDEEVQKNILVVDDSSTARMLLKNILDAAGYGVITAVDGMDAFTLLKTHPFDLVVSDVEMPRLNGFDLTEKIRKDKMFQALPVILCTSRGSREDREHGIAVGANAYIDKSQFQQSNLLEVIKKFV